MPTFPRGLIKEASLKKRSIHRVATDTELENARKEDNIIISLHNMFLLNVWDIRANFK